MNAETFDPQAPFIAQDGLEYEDLAAYICGTPAHCARNNYIQAHRAAGRSEEAIRIWIAAYDGDDPTPSISLPTREYYETVRSKLDRAGRATDSLYWPV